MTKTRTIGAAILMAGAAIALSAPASAAGVSIGVDFGRPFTGTYDYSRPCEYYRDYDVPAPARCREYLSAYWGPAIYVDGDFIFHNRDDYSRWNQRADYQHWRKHDYTYRTDESTNGGGTETHTTVTHTETRTMHNGDQDQNGPGDQDHDHDDSGH